MSTEQPVTTVGDTDANQDLTDNQTAAADDAASQITEPASVTAGGDAAPTHSSEEDAAPTHAREEEDEPRAGGEDFGSLLDRFEQEQSTLQEGEVVRGTVVGITERGVVIDFGYKSEGIVNQNEFMESGQITVKRGDEVDVLVKNMETGEGYPLLSRATLCACGPGTIWKKPSTRERRLKAA